MTDPMSTTALLDIADLTVTVPASKRGTGPQQDIELVHGVSFRVAPGERLALVGESGSGKTTIARSILRLDPELRLGGSILLDGTEVTQAGDSTMRGLRGAVASMVLQDPMTALNPVLTIGAQVAEPLRIRGVGRRESLRRATDMLGRLGVPDASRRLRAYPQEFSGGMRQRVVLATALIAKPRLLIADEPTTALDVRVQEQVMDLIAEQSAELNLAVLLITHDLALVAGFAQRIAVLRHGSIVEQGSVDEIFANPRRGYTRGLLGAIPRIDGDRSVRLSTVDDFEREGAVS